MDCARTSSKQRIELGVSSRNETLRSLHDFVGACGIVAANFDVEAIACRYDVCRNTLGNQRAVRHLGHFVADRSRARDMTIDDPLQPFLCEPGHRLELDGDADCLDALTL